MSLCDKCFQGVRHEGTPEGKIESIGAKHKVEVYVATPTGEYDKTKAILFFPDVFGMQLVNAQLLADGFAKNGFKTYIVDYFKGDSWPVDATDEGSLFDKQAWFGKHVGPNSSPSFNELVESVIDHLKAGGITRFGTTGYCFGARSGFDFALKNLTHVTVVAHPSLLKVPEDFEKYLASSKAPLLINSCTVDSQFPLEAQAKADELLGGGKFAPGYERAYWDGCEHGFAVRGNLSDPKVKAGKEGAFEKSVAFFKKHL